MLERPDLTDVAPDILAYIEALEAKLLSLQLEQERPRSRPRSSADETAPEPSEPPTTINVISASEASLAKRTPRHFYSRQRRSGMGVFDLETEEEDPPAHLLLADQAEDYFLITSLGKIFRLKVNELVETAVRGRGRSLIDTLPFRLQDGETVAALLADRQEKYVVLLSERGWVRRIMANYLSPRMIQGTSFHDVKNGGPLVSACWSPGDAELFVATEQGLAIRFSEKQVPTSGCRGLRVPPDDRVVGGTAVYEDSGVFLLGYNGRGTVRLMSGFRANKAPGAGGKVALKTDKLVGVSAVKESDDIFILSRLGKIIRFQASEIPAKTGAVQGVHCMSLRADETVAMAISSK